MPTKKVTPKPGLFPVGAAVQAFDARTSRVQRHEGSSPLEDPLASGVIGSDGAVEITAAAGEYVLFLVTNEKQHMRVEATGGVFMLLLGEDETAEIGYDASSAEVRASLEELAPIGVGNVEVTGGPGDEGGTKPYVVTFQGELSGLNIPVLAAKDEELEGSEAQVTITTMAGGTKAPAGGSPRTCAFTIDAE